MNGQAHPYARLLRQRWAPSLLAVGVLARVPLQAYSFAVLLLVVERTGSYPAAGAVTAATGAAYAVCVPVHARLVDRHGQTVPLLAASAANAAAFAGLILAARPGAGAVVLGVWAALVGATLPPVAAAARALWSTVVDDPAVRRAALAADALVLDLALVAGPLAVTGASLLADPAWALGGCAAALLGGTVWFARLAPSRRWRPAARRGGLLGPLRSPGVRLLLAVSVLTGALLGTLRLGFVAFADEHALPEAGGLALAAFGLGSLLGGLAYGAVAWRGDTAARFPALVAGYALSAAVLPFAPGIGVLLVLCLAAGAWLAPIVIANFELVGRVAPEGTLTESFAWGITATFAGASLGNLAGGLLAEASAAGAFAAAAGFGALAAGCALAGRGALAPPPAPSARPADPDSER
ncbi:MFS transporter [Allonocardiopsis opalescens]|uniref:MFS family arabinose efflux permease n=1 Tax=Allonocardiopsis opalescens TaxID=1144618 RepID=A0A2T0QEX0_9ACTN|nr:MFS transporter [Allonocardiopsis opalescens]PRY02469.1 hypothetical protein CLV72_1011071 [Allonocardiopsis opalescens]